MTFTLDQEILARATYMAEQLEQEHPGLRFTRFDAIRSTLAKHLPTPPAGWEPNSREAPTIERSTAQQTKTGLAKPRAKITKPKPR